MTIEERMNACLDKIAEINQGGGTDEEKQDMQAALELLGVKPNG